MLPVAYVEHQVRGRLRLRIPAKRGDVTFFQSVVEALSRHPAVNELTANPLTGGILVYHSGSAQPITAAAANEELFEIGQNPAESALVQESDAEVAVVQTESPGTLEALTILLSGLALFQVSQGNVTGSASENVWHAYNADRVLDRPGLAMGLLTLAVFQLLRGELLGSASSLLFYALVMHRLAAMKRGEGGTGRADTDTAEPATGNSA